MKGEDLLRFSTWVLMCISQMHALLSFFVKILIVVSVDELGLLWSIVVNIDRDLDPIIHLRWICYTKYTIKILSDVLIWVSKLPNILQSYFKCSWATPFEFIDKMYKKEEERNKEEVLQSCSWFKDQSWDHWIFFAMVLDFWTMIYIFLSQRPNEEMVKEKEEDKC